MTKHYSIVQPIVSLTLKTSVVETFYSKLLGITCIYYSLLYASHHYD